jgi:hypothetical protein
MVAYNYVKTVNDIEALFAYVKSNVLFASLQSLTDNNSTLVFIFPTALSAGDQTALTAFVNSYVDPITTTLNNQTNLSVFNSSMVPLIAAANFTGNWEDVSRYASIRVCCCSNVSSAINGVVLEFGILSPQVDSSKTYTLSVVNSIYTLINTVRGRYFRVRYINGASAQTTLFISTFWSVSATTPIVQANETVNDQSDCTLTRALAFGRGDNTQYQPLRLDEQQQLRVRLPGRLNKVSCISATPIVQQSFTYNVNTDVCDILVTGSGTVTNSLGRAVITNGTTTANSAATLTTVRYARCSAGNIMTIVVGCSFSAGVASVTQLVGAGTPSRTSGVFWGFNGTAFGVFLRSNSVLTFVAQAQFNVDLLDGKGPSGILINPLMGNQYMITYDAHGFGVVSFFLLAPLVTNIPEATLVHRISFGNNSTSLGILNPQFPCMASVIGSAVVGATATINVSDMCAYLDGDPRAAILVRTAEAARSLTVATAYTPVLTLNNRATFNGVENTSTVQIRHISISCSNSSVNMYLAIFLNPTTSALTYTNVNTTNSVMAFSTTANSTMTAGTGISQYSTTIVGQNATLDLTEHDIFISPADVLCIACKLGASSTIATSITVSFSEWQ